ncbi:MAG: M15 family metallopeptidase [Fimbriimonas sp.]|nr:M15 family metallopeptidase [Fimbriimonas sp.]
MIKWDRSKGRPEPIRFLNRITEIECGEPLVSVVEACPSLRIIRPQAIPYVRKSVAAMCEAAAQRLPPGYILGLVEGWRPIDRQQRIYDFFWKCAEEAFPHRNHAALRRTVCRFVAPTDQKAPPGHCTGGAVDVWLVDERGEPIDVNAPFDRFRAAPTHTYGLTPGAQRNRSVLLDAMLSVGFSNCRDEWWHYSYGDAGWAVRMDRRECVYGLAHLDPELYADLEKLWIEAAKERPNPFAAYLSKVA